MIEMMNYLLKSWVLCISAFVMGTFIALAVQLSYSSIHIFYRDALIPILPPVFDFKQIGPADMTLSS